MQDIYIYNNTFKGLLCLIYELLQKKIKPYNIKGLDYTPNLFDNLIKLNLKYDGDIIQKFIEEFGNYNFKIIYYVYLSLNAKKEIIIYYYLKNYYNYYRNLPYMRNLKCVDEALKISKKVSAECHKFKGFTRFKKLKNNVYYAEINPDNDILELLSIHFKRRLKNEFWLINDVNRKIISMYNKKDFEIIPSGNWQFKLETSEEENIFLEMWQQFYETVSIKERENLACRRNFMPKKYWKYIEEVKKEL